LTDTLINEDGEEVMLDAPTGDELPKNGFDAEDKGFSKADGRGVEVTVSETSDFVLLFCLCPMGRKTLLVQLLIKAFGNVFTDHISMAGMVAFPRTFR
jgi:aconitate hydratase